MGWLFGRRRVAPTTTAGVPGVAIYAGYPEVWETSNELVTPEKRYTTYANILANTSIVAAGVRYFLNLIASSTWTFTPAEADTDGQFAERLEAMLTEDPDTPWHRIVRRAAMYRFYGFSVQEWTMKRHEEGYFTYADIAPRAQKTIYRWDVEPTGKVLGVVQQDPHSSEYIYLPRNKVLYVVDDTLHDSPEGLGLFRHLVEPAHRLQRYLQLEGHGFETDLRGIPVGYAPFAELARMVQAEEITQTDRERLEKPMREFIKNHIRTPKLSLLLDSAVYASEDEAARPVNVKQWQVDLLKGSANSFAENAAAIERTNRELARILNVEQLLLGATATGSLALSEDKTHAFHQVIEGALTEICEAVDADIIDRAWAMNGWPDEMKPKATTAAIRYRDVAQIGQVLRDIATAGAPLEPDDPAINDVRDLMGVERVDLEEQRRRADEDAVLRREEMEAMRTAPPNDDDPGSEEGMAA